MRSEDLGQIAMRVGELHDQAPPLFEHLGGDVNEMAAEAFPLPAHDLGGQRQLRDPLAQVPGQPGDLKPCPVAHKLCHRHAPACDPGAELLDDVLLIAALVGQIDNLARRVGTRQIGEHQAVAKELEECSLAVFLLDADAPHDHPTGTVESGGLVGNLGDPLPDSPQPAKVPLLGSEFAIVGGTSLARRPRALAALGARHERLPGILGELRRRRRAVGIRPPMAKYAPKSIAVCNTSARSKSVSPRTIAVRKWRWTHGSTWRSAPAAASEERAL